MLTTCHRCLVEKPANEFYKDATRTSGKAYICKDCKKELVIAYRLKNADRTREYQRQWNKDNIQRVRSSQAKYRRNNPEKLREDKYKRTYGISIKDYETMVEQQSRLCLICQKPETKKGNRLSVDHCHQTGKIRGLLCNECNTGLGLFQDDPFRLDRAISYLNGAL